MLVEDRWLLLGTRINNGQPRRIHALRAIAALAANSAGRTKSYRFFHTAGPFTALCAFLDLLRGLYAYVWKLFLGCATT